MTDDEDLIWGVITPLRFMQLSTMLPFLTLLGLYLESFQWLGISFGLAGTTLFIILLGRGVWERRKLPWQLWVLFVAQLGVTAWVLASWRDVL